MTTLRPRPGSTHDPGGTTDPTGGITPQPLTGPQVCGVVGWTSVIANRSNAMNVSVAVNASSGVTLLSVPDASAARSSGFNISERMTVSAGTKIPIDDTFTAVSVSTVGNRIVVDRCRRDERADRSRSTQETSATRSRSRSSTAT